MQSGSKWKTGYCSNDSQNKTRVVTTVPSVLFSTRTLVQKSQYYRTGHHFHRTSLFSIIQRGVANPCFRFQCPHNLNYHLLLLSGKTLIQKSHKITIWTWSVLHLFILALAFALEQIPLQNHIFSRMWVTYHLALEGSAALFHESKAIRLRIDLSW